MLFKPMCFGIFTNPILDRLVKPSPLCLFVSLCLSLSLMWRFCVAQYVFSGNYDLVQFIKEIQKQGLYVSLRIGPFIESEWNYGYVCRLILIPWHPWTIPTCITSIIRLKNYCYTKKQSYFSLLSKFLLSIYHHIRCYY